MRHHLRGQPIVALPQLLAPDSRLADHRRGLAQRLNCSVGGAADAGHLDPGLVAPALREQLFGRGELDAVRPQPIGQRHRELRRNGRVADAESGNRTEAHLLFDLPLGMTRGDQLVPSEVVDQQALELGGLGRDPRVLERVGEDSAAAVGFEVEEGISDRHRHLVAERRGGLGIAVDENVHRTKGSHNRPRGSHACPAPQL